MAEIMIRWLFSERGGNRKLIVVVGLLLAVIAGHIMPKINGATQIALLVSVAAGSAILIAGRWSLLVSLMALSLFSRGIWNVWGDVTAADLLFGFLGLCLALAFSKRRSANVLKGERFLRLSLIWVALVILGAGFAFISFSVSDLGFSIKTIVQSAEFLVWCAYIAYFFTSADVRLLVNLEIAFGLGLACFTLYEATYGTVELMGTQIVFGNKYSQFHNVLTLNPQAILLLVPTFWLVAFSVRRTWVRLSLLAMLLYVFVVSTSRTLYFTVAAGLVIYLWLTRNPQGWITVAFVVVMVGLATWSVVLPELEEVYLGSQDFILHIRRATVLGTTQRILVWLTAIQVMLRSPLFGTGVGGFGLARHYYPDLALVSPLAPEQWRNPSTNLGLQAHSQYFQVLADHGIAGFILFVFFLWEMWQRHNRAWRTATDVYFRQVSLALLVSFLSLVFGFIGQSLLYRVGSNLVSLFFWYNVALILLLEKAGNAHDPNIAPASTSVRVSSNEWTDAK